VAPSPTDPVLDDGVVSLRAWEESDAAAIAAACDDPEIARWLDMIPSPYTVDDARIYIEQTKSGRAEGRTSPFAITDAETGAVLGAVDVHWIDPEQKVAEIGYWAASQARGRGVVTRAVRLLAGWVLGELGFERLQLRADTLNEPSCRVAERAGFTRDGTLRSVRYNARQSRRIDFAVYSLLRGEQV